MASALLTDKRGWIAERADERAHEGWGEAFSELHQLDQTFCWIKAEQDYEAEAECQERMRRGRRGGKS